MCGCFVLMLGAFAPRLALALMALFNDEITKAFDGSWVIPLIGWFLLPYTTLVYVLLSWWTDGGVSRVRVVLRGTGLLRRPRLLRRWLQPAVGLPALLPDDQHLLSTPRAPARRSPDRRSEAIRPAGDAQRCLVVWPVLAHAPAPDGRETHGNQGRHQRIRPHRPDGVPCRRPELPGHDPGGWDQRPARPRVPGLHAQVRLGAWPLQGRRLGRGLEPHRQRQHDPPDRRARSRRPGVGRRGRGGRRGVHGPVPGQRVGVEAPRGRREEGHPVRTVQGRHPDVRVRRELRQLRGPGHHLQRVLHHQLPGADRQGHQRQLRHQAWPDDHRARGNRDAEDR